MGSDVSRVRFDPRRDFAGTVLQQGRLLLDADFNEVVALLDRRLRAETNDLTSFGPDPKHAGVAWVPRQTPDAFRVSATGGVLTIGRGRMYVDGLLAENHGGPPDGFDPLLSEPVGTTDLDYTQQPYWPAPDPLPAAGPHLAYLDVWAREVTSLEDPNLVEIAVGVDTTARVQTAWQVRLLADIGSATCASADDDIPGWLDVIRPSAARLTTGTVPIDAKDDPCALPPTGGYRGLENQTYRVEVHDGGALGTATFKWSRDNGSVAMPVVEMVAPTVLRLASVGKDDVLRVSTGDWVEILDDHYEFGRVPGEIRKVVVDDAERTITFDTAIPSDLRPANAADAAARHLRVRRWDQSGIVRTGAGATLTDLDQPGATGLIPVPATAGTEIVLEHGVVVSFSVAGTDGTLHAGDYWVFAARTADTSVETLTDAPPLGVHHRYARLGTVTFPDGETDCRRLWPPVSTGGTGDCGDCTVCVTPETQASGTLTVQAAIDQVAATGGTVCLAAGVYDVGDGVRIERARSVRLRGQGPATVLVAGGNVVSVIESFFVVLERFAAISGAGAPAAVLLRSVVATTVQDVVVASYRARGEGGANGAAVELSGVAIAVTLQRNILVGPVGVDAGAQEKIGVFSAVLRVEDNLVFAANRGIDLGGLSAYFSSCRVGNNEIIGGAADGIFATGAVAPGSTLHVVGNEITTNGTGISVGADALVDANTINGNQREVGADGIVMVAGGFAAGPGDVRITGNRVYGRSGAGIALRTAVRTFMVKQNMVATVGAGVVIEGRGLAERTAVENNEVFDVGTDESGGAAVGIAIARSGAAAVVGNTVARVAPRLVEGRIRAGIVVTACADTRVSGNVVDEIGPADGYVGIAAGIVVVGPFDRAVASENSIRFGPATEAPRDGHWYGLLIQSAGRELVAVGTHMYAVAVGNGAVVLNKFWAYAAPARGDHVTVTANAITGGGPLPTCLVRVDGDVVTDANQATHLQPGEPLAVLLAGSSITASTNRVRGEKAMILLEVREDRFAALGNLAAGGTHLNGLGNGLPGPWQPLNPIVP